MADEAAGEADEGFVDVRSAFVAGAEAPVLMQPGECSFDDPALAAEVRSVVGVALSEHWLDAERA